MNSSIDKIIFEKIDKPPRITEVLIKNIEKTVVTKITKDVVNAHQKFRKFKKQNTRNNNFPKFDENNKNHSNSTGIERDFEKFLYENNIEQKYLLINNFLLYIVLHSGVRIELIIQNYEDYKDWVNGLGVLIKQSSKTEFSKK